MHRAAGHVAAKTEGAWLVGNEGNRGGLTGIGLDRNAVAIDVQAMHHIRADELERDRIAGIDLKLGGGIGKLACFDPEGPRLRRSRLNRQWCERHHQSSHC